ncbi:MAG: glycosyltransferase, partial [Alphaproteobacteria bacterium]
MLSVVIPTLDSASGLERTLDSLAEGDALVGEVIAADGGSRDGSRDIAARRG